MSKNLTDVDTFTDPIVVPEGTDSRNDAAGDVELLAQGLANRTYNQKLRLDNNDDDFAERGVANTFTQFNQFGNGVNVTGGNLYLTNTAGNFVVQAGDATIDAGDLTVTAGDLEVTAGLLKVLGDHSPASALQVSHGATIGDGLAVTGDVEVLSGTIHANVGADMYCEGGNLRLAATRSFLYEGTDGEKTRYLGIPLTSGVRNSSTGNVDFLGQAWIATGSFGIAFPIPRVPAGSKLVKLYLRLKSESANVTMYCYGRSITDWGVTTSTVPPVNGYGNVTYTATATNVDTLTLTVTGSPVTLNQNQDDLWVYVTGGNATEIYGLRAEIILAAPASGH